MISTSSPPQETVAFAKRMGGQATAPARLLSSLHTSPDRPLDVDNGGCNPPLPSLRGSNCKLTPSRIAVRLLQSSGRNLCPLTSSILPSTGRIAQPKCARSLASVEGRDAQDTMLRMAQHYDRLATTAEQRTKEERRLKRARHPKLIPRPNLIRYLRGGSPLKMPIQPESTRSISPVENLD